MKGVSVLLIVGGIALSLSSVVDFVIVGGWVYVVGTVVGVAATFYGTVRLVVPDAD